MTHSLIGRGALATCLSLTASPVLANSLCYGTSTVRAEAELQQELSTLPPKIQGIHAKYEAARQRDNGYEVAFRRDLTYELMSRPEGEYLIHTLERIFDRVAADTAEPEARDLDPGRWGPAAPTVARLRRALRADLVDKVPASQIEERLNGIGSNDPAAIERALGYMTVAETNLLMFGPNPLAPTPDSLVGKYLAETGAASVVRTFGTAPIQGQYGQPIDPNSPQGPQRLVIAVSEATLPIYKKYFTLPNLMFHAHQRGQGTLMIGHMDRVGSYAAVQRPDTPDQYGNLGLRISEGAIWPQIILSTSEAGRARTYLDIGIRDNATVKSPWSRLPNYCATGGYASCTHWWGEMGIGDRRVNEWVFPGFVDDHASNPTPGVARENDRGPRRQALGAYTMPAHLDPVTKAQVRRFMTFPQGSEQLAVMVGTEAQLVAGEWANPGYVALSLLSRARQDRVPMITYNVTDARQPIPANFEPGVRAY